MALKLTTALEDTWHYEQGRTDVLRNDVVSSHRTHNDLRSPQRGVILSYKRRATQQRSL